MNETSKISEVISPESSEIGSVISPELLKCIVQIATETAISIANEHHNKYIEERGERKLRNTKLLLRNYRMFKAHSDKAVSELMDIEEDTYAIFERMMLGNDTSLFVDSIHESIARTRIIVTHIDRMLEIYKTYCENTGREEEQRRCRVIFAMYINDTKTAASQIAENECIDIRTVYKDIDVAVETLSALIFGIDGLKCEK